MIDHVGLGVSDLDASKAFYERALGPLGYRLLIHAQPEPRRRPALELHARTRTRLAWSLWLATFGCCAAGRLVDALHGDHAQVRRALPQLPGLLVGLRPVPALRGR